MAICLLPKLRESFKKAIVSGELDIFKLIDMTSEQRRQVFADKFGERNAKGINSLLESKLILKNQQKGLENWVKQLTGLKEPVKQDLISKIQKMDKILTPESERVFFEDLASTRLGADITLAEATKISEMANKIKELETNTDKTKADVTLGRAKMDLTEYVNSISATKANLLTNIVGVPRSLMASLDLSAPLNQGWGMLSRKQFYTSLVKMINYAKSEEAFKNLQAEIITSPEYASAKKAGLRITELSNKLERREEQFMSSLLDKVPGIRASERAYVGFLNKLRFDVYKDLIKKAEVAGEDVGLGSKSAEDIANVVNNFTGGARVGRVEGAVPTLNAVFFSPRKIVSTLNMIDPRNYLNPKISRTARLAATRNLIGSLAISSTIIGLAQMFGSDKPETDPTSSDFGKIKVGDTRLDVSGGNATYANLLSRLWTGKIKSSSGYSRKVGDFGVPTPAELVGNFLRYKLSPNASFLVDSIVGSNAIGEKKTITQSAVDRFKPMFANSVVELLQSDTNGKFAFTLGALFGGGLNTYKQETNWNESEGKEVNQFKTKVGQTKFDEANKIYNKTYEKWFDQVKDNPKYTSLSDENKQRVIINKKNKLKKAVFKYYGFKYKQQKSKPLPKL